MEDSDDVINIDNLIKLKDSLRILAENLLYREDEFINNKISKKILPVRRENFS